VLVLLPPSEGKAASGRGRPVDLGSLSLPVLREPRHRVLDALVDLCAGPDSGHARTVLGLSPGLAAEVGRNARLREAGALPVARLYTGVLYEALDLASLPAPARRLVQRWTLVFSGLWGVLRLGDKVPPYRCPMGVALPGIGPLGAYWRRALAPVIDGAGPILDLRSSAYATAWSPAGDLARRTVAVRILHERDGTRSVVSHFNKATKGRLLRGLALADARPRSVADLVATLKALDYRVEELGPGRLDIVVTEV
jgi:cytoplasmic iron level regulating protein YaaA (DUF328/UPF0246 family)